MVPQAMSIAGDVAKRAFTRRRLNWIDDARMDRRVSDNDFRIVHAIASWMDWRSEAAIAGHDEIAARACKSKRGVQLAVARLVEIGVLTVQPGTGRGNKNTYRIGSEMAHADAPFVSDASGTKARTPKDERAHSDTENGVPACAPKDSLVHEDITKKGSLRLPPSEYADSLESARASRARSSPSSGRKAYDPFNDDIPFPDD